MKLTLIVLCISIASVVSAQNSNRGLIYNKELKVLAGNWKGNMVYTDFKKNNSQFTLPTKLVITDLNDSLEVKFLYVDSDGKEKSDTSILRIYDTEDKLRIDGELYDIVSTVRKGPTMMIVGEKQGFDNNRVADLQQTVTFGPTTLKIVKEVRYMENEFFFIRNRTAFNKQ